MGYLYVTNAVRFDTGTINNYLFYASTLGEFTQMLTKPRVMQFGSGTVSSYDP